MGRIRPIKSSAARLDQLAHGGLSIVAVGITPRQARVTALVLRRQDVPMLEPPRRRPSSALPGPRRIGGCSEIAHLGLITFA
jgi:hypothetical protein